MAINYSSGNTGLLLEAGTWVLSPVYCIYLESCIIPFPQLMKPLETPSINFVTVAMVGSSED